MNHEDDLEADYLSKYGSPRLLGTDRNVLEVAPVWRVGAVPLQAPKPRNRPFTPSRIGDQPKKVLYHGRMAPERTFTEQLADDMLEVMSRKRMRVRLARMRFNAWALGGVKT